MMKIGLEEFVHFCKQGVGFIGISGIGWIIDFVVFNILGFMGINYGICNIFSSLCGVTFVFLVSTQKTFRVNKKQITLTQKYGIYITYQIAMILVASKFVGLVSNRLLETDILILIRFAGILAKIFVTPFTMTLNFVFMKLLIEKI